MGDTFFIDKCVQRVYNYGDIRFYERRDDMKKQITAFLTAAVLSFGAVPAAETVLPDSVQTGIFASAADNAPAKVKGVKASSVTQTTALLSWNSVSKAKGYRIYVYDAKAKKYTKVTTVKSTAVSYKLIGLTPDTEYKYKVRAYKKVNDKTVWGTASEAAAFTTKTYAPAQVKNVKASAKSASKIKLSWGKVTNAKGYRIYKYNDSTKKFEKVTTVGSGTTSYTVTGLSKGKSYKFKVRAYRKVSGVTYWGKPSAAVSVTTKKVDEQMAQELRKVGEEKFYDIADLYTVISSDYKNNYRKSAIIKPYSLENVKILTETDNEFFICGNLVIVMNWDGVNGIHAGDRTHYIPVACKAYISDGQVKVDALTTEWIYNIVYTSINKPVSNSIELLLKEPASLNKEMFDSDFSSFIETDQHGNNAWLPYPHITSP